MKENIASTQLSVSRKSTGKVKSFLKNISPFNNRTDMPAAQLALKKLLAFGLCYLTGIFLAEGLVIGVLFGCGKNFLHGEMFSDSIMTLLKLYGMIVPLAVSVIYWKVTEKRKLAEMGVTKNTSGWLIGAVLGILLIFVSVSAIMVTGTIRYSSFTADNNIAILLLMLGGFIVQGAAEEFLSRGLVFCGLRDKVSLPVAVGANAIVFTLPHLSTLSGSAVYILSGILSLIVISCLFSFLTIRTKSIWAACGLHSMWNFCLSCVLGLNLSGSEGTSSAVINMEAAGEGLLNGGKYGIEASIITCTVIAAASAVVWHMNKSGNAERQA